MRCRWWRREPAAAAGLALVLLLPSAARPRPLISEFMARPAGEEGEWFEILNAGESPLELEGWSVRDGTGRPRLLPELPPLPPGGRLVLAARPESLRAAFPIPDSALVARPSGWPTLNDSDAAAGLPADWIVLADPAGAVLDSVAYFASWLPEERGRSVERAGPGAPSTDAGSWGWSVHPLGATPGARNSLEDAPARGGNVLEGPSEVHPARRPELYAYRLPGPGVMALWLVDRGGRRLAVLRPPGPVAAAGQWVWGAQAPAPPRSGPYFLCLLWRSSDGGRPLRSCRSVWVER